MSAKSLTPRSVHGGTVSNEGEHLLRLTIPAGEDGHFRLAQLDDYMNLPRRRFLWNAPLTISLQVRCSHSDYPGTRGFGLWNDPFNFSLGFGGGNLLPVLPNAAWFFFASPPNHLSFRDDLPANGPLAAAFRSPRIPAWLMAPALLAVPLLPILPIARLARRIAGGLIAQDAARLEHDLTEWRNYRMQWNTDNVSFFIDDQLILSTQTVPRGPLGFVLWIDNQYAAWTPDGRMNFGRLASQEGWIEIKDLTIRPGSSEDK